MAPIQQKNTSSGHDTIDNTSSPVRSGKHFTINMNSKTSGNRRQCEPGVSQPSVSQPSVSQPSVSQPSVSQPSVSQPGVSQPTEAFLLPITCRGHFYHDTFFSEARKHFDVAVRDVLDHWGHRSPLDDDLTTYRRLRQANLTEASQAVNVSENHKHHQVVLDVRDFLSGDVKVKVVDENELVVEGSVEQRQEGSVSKKSFYRRFFFPGLVRPEVVTSTMSSDGVLTVTVPKKEHLSHTTQVDVTRTNTTANSSTVNGMQGENTNKFVNHLHKGMNSESTKTTEHKDQKWNSKLFNKNSEATKLSTNSRATTNTSGTGGTLLDQTSDFLLPISHRGLFFHDSFFTEARQDFEAAVKRIVDSWEDAPVSDHMTCYRRLRERDLKEENQAVSVTENHQAHKVVLDVRDFLSGDVKVKVVDENELVVEGSVEQRQEGSVSKKSFNRRFFFPGLVRPEAVTSTMSSDGVLTVTVPKKECLTHTQEVTVNKIDNTANSYKLHHGIDSERIKESKTTENKDFKLKKSVQFNGDMKANTTNSQTKTSTSGTRGSSPDQTSDFLLPISHRGPFFHDSFFAETRQDFEAAVKRIVDSWEDAPASDHMTCYRRLRERNLEEDNQAISITESQHSHKVVLDVRDFLSGDVKVKVVDENELVVEGSVEQQQEGSVSKKSFYRQFSFPGLVRPEAVTSTMSSDGVLTVTIPKKEHLSHTTQVDVTRTNTTANSSTVNGMQGENTNKFVNHLHKGMNSESTKTTEHKDQKWNSKLFNTNSEATKLSTNSRATTNTSGTGGTLLDQTSDFLLPISHRGLFFHDSFFTEARQDFEAAVKRIVDSWEDAPVSDHMTCYRRLRERDLKEENQAVSVTENHQAHKVVLDVRDFLSGDVKVKVVDENELVVEGSVEQRQEGSVSKKSFYRRFSFPGLVRPEAVTSTMSSDGVLTVTVPKKECLTHTQEVTVNKIDNTANSYKLHHGIDSERIKESKTTENKDFKLKKSVQFNGDMKANTTNSQTKTSTSGTRGSSPDQTSDFLLPISHRGPFFHDSFFAETRQDFEAAVKRIVDSWEDAPASDHMTCYRRLRERNLEEDNQAISITESQHSHKVVLDVRDFLSGDVKVKVVDENELVVEGSVEQRQEGSVSKKSFYRRFFFPGLVRPEAVTSTMSSDGVLTVTVPKKEESKTTKLTYDSSDVTKTNVQEKEVKHLSSSNIRNSKRLEQLSADARRSSLNEHSKVETQNSTAKPSCSRSLFNKSSNNAETFGSNHKETATNKFTVNEHPWVMESELPIFHKGLFLHDSFFQDARQNFEAAIKEILTKFTTVKSDTDDLSFYRSLRQRDLRDENQALKVTEEQHSYQVVIDVHDFMSGDVKVKAVGKNEVVVEGSVEKTDGDFKSSKNFCRRFKLPGMDLEAITSAISSDGVLTIRAPKSSWDARVTTASKAQRTPRHRRVSEQSSSSQEENSHEKNEERDGFTCHTFTNTSSHQNYTSKV